MEELAVRKADDIFYDIIKRMDSVAANSFRAHASKIASQLDYIATIPDLTANIVKTKVYNFYINSLGLSGGTAIQIADAIKWAVDFLVL